MTPRKLRLLADCIEQGGIVQDDRRGWANDLRGHAKSVERSVMLDGDRTEFSVPPAQEHPDSTEWWRTVAKQMSARIFLAERALNSIALNHAEPARSGVMQAICALNGEFEKTGDSAARTAPEAQR